jgi:hypothetical protein
MIVKDGYTGISIDRGIPTPIAQSTYDATWLELDGGDSEANVINSSKIIVKGKILSQSTRSIVLDENDEGTYFTISKLEVTEIQAKDASLDEKVIQPNKEGKVILNVTQTGAVVNGKNKNIIGDAPLFKQGVEYVLFLDDFEMAHSFLSAVVLVLRR